MAAAPDNRTAFFRRLALSAGLALSISAVTGCVTEAPGQTAPVPASDASVGPNALRDQPASDASVPAGCTREWSAVAMDSVLNCPDIPPPRRK